MVMLDSTVVKLALKTIQLRMHASYSGGAVDRRRLRARAGEPAFTGGTLGDLFGRRRAFISGLALFTGGSVMCALAPSTSFLIGSRVVAGRRRRPRAAAARCRSSPTPSATRASAPGRSVCGPASRASAGRRPAYRRHARRPLRLAEHLLIRRACGVVAGMAALFVPESSDRDGRSLDLPGQVTAVIGWWRCIYAFVEANTYGWTSLRIGEFLVVSAVALDALSRHSAARPQPAAGSSSSSATARSVGPTWWASSSASPSSA